MNARSDTTVGVAAHSCRLSGDRKERPYRALGNVHKKKNKKPIDNGRKWCYYTYKPIKKIGKTKKGVPVEMSVLFLDLLRSNFRCGRMLHSRADDMAGCK